MPEPDNSQGTATEHRDARIVLEHTADLCREIRPTFPASVGLDSDLERELGLDSLARAQLVQRLEQRFDVSLPERVVRESESPRDLLRALFTARKSSTPPSDSALQLEPLGDSGNALDHATTLLGVLDWHAERHPERVHIHHCATDDRVETLTYGELRNRASSMAAGLLERGFEPGGTVALMLPTCLEYFCSFFAVLLAGGTPVPLYPAARPSHLEDHLRRQAAILRNANSRLLVSEPRVLSLARILRSQVETLGHVVTPDELEGSSPSQENLAILPRVTELDTALIQYTSGSTGDPKGVVLTHRNLLASLSAMGRAAELTPDDILVSWLPLYHDMGLIGAWMGSLTFASPLVLQSPLAFLTRPARWLQTISRYRGTISAAPNFAYELCLAKIKDEEIQGIDLSSWRLALNGAEPVSPKTLLRFQERFERLGFRPNAFMPVYGLAESSLGVTFSPPGRGPAIDAIQRQPFLLEGRAVPAEKEDQEALRFVGAGFPVPDHQVRVVDGAGTELGERQEGRLEITGPSVTSGYFRNGEATRQLFHDNWLESGDRAYIAGGELFLTGRSKDLIIRAGRNLHPQELEETVGGLPGIRKGCVAVFGSPDPESGTERLIVLAETREQEPRTLAALEKEIIATASDLVGTPPDRVILAPPHTVPKTSSGKIRRAASRELFENGTLSSGRRSVAWQLLRLTLSAARPQLRRALRAGRDLLYSTWVWLLSLALAPWIWCGVVLLPGADRRWRFAGFVSRTLLRLAGLPVQVQGLEHLPKDAPAVLAPNHGSYLDGLVLLATLPCRLIFVAKGELEGSLLFGPFLRRLGVLYVERFDSEKSVRDKDQAVDAVEAGESLLLFPEGTFVRAPGLLPFRMGAFVVAAQARVPVVPVVLRGTRSVLRAGQWRFLRGPISVHVLPPVLPESNDWKAAMSLRNTVRQEILRHCGEPDMSSSPPETVLTAHRELASREGPSR